MRFYLDTNIWIDIIEKRPGWKAAAKLLMCNIVVSDIVLFELLKFYPDTEVSSYMKMPHQLVRISSGERAEAWQLVHKRNVSFGDAAHAVLSRNHGCILISKDGDFLLLSDIAKPYTPQELL